MPAHFCWEDNEDSWTEIHHVILEFSFWMYTTKELKAEAP